MKGVRRSRVRGGTVGAAAAACAVCCAAPVLTLLGLGLTGAAAAAFAAAFAGIVFGLVVAVATVAAVVTRRRQARPVACPDGAPPGPVHVELGSRPDEPSRRQASYIPAIRRKNLPAGVLPAPASASER
jgi:hypothetical protein